MKKFQRSKNLPEHDYRLIAERIRLPLVEIARMSGVGPITVGSILGTRTHSNFFGKEAEAKVHDAIDLECANLRDYLNRLSGGALE